MDVLKRKIVEMLKARAAMLPRNNEYRQALLEVAACIAHNNHNPYMSLKDYRKRSGYSVEDISQYLHVYPQEYRKAENGCNMPKDWLIVLADIYGVPYEHLLYAQIRLKNKRSYQQSTSAR